MAGSPNPGGQNRRLVRTILAAWITAQRIPGLDHVFRSEQPEYRFEDFRTGQPDYSCLVVIMDPADDEDRAAYVGPLPPGGQLIHYHFELLVIHRSYNPDDWDNDADDRDRVVDALKDCMHGRGRDLGRPDVILAAGEHPRRRKITFTPFPPVLADGGAVDRWGVMRFQVSQYTP